MKKTEKELIDAYEGSLPACPLPYSEVEKKVDFERYAKPQGERRRRLWLIPVSIAVLALSVILPITLLKTPSLDDKDQIILALGGVEKTLRDSKGEGFSTSSPTLKKASYSDRSLSLIRSFLVSDSEKSEPELSPDDYPFTQLFFARDILKSLSSFAGGKCLGFERMGSIGFDFSTYEPSSSVFSSYSLTTKVSYAITDQDLSGKKLDGETKNVEVQGVFALAYQCHDMAISQLFPFHASILYDFSSSSGPFEMTLLSGDIRENFPSEHQESTYEYAYLSSANSLVREYRHFYIVSKTPLLIDSAHPCFQNYLDEGVSYVDEAEIYDGERYAKSQRTGIADESGQKGSKTTKEGIGIPIVDDFGCNEKDLDVAEWGKKTFASENGVASAIASLEEKTGKPLALQLLDENGRDYNFEEE